MGARLTGLLLSAATLSGGLAIGLAPTAASAAPITTAAYVPLPNPERLLDTRATGPVGAGQTVSVTLTGTAPRPAVGSGVTAAVLNVTALGPSAPGYWTVFPHDGALPDASNLNIDERAALDGDALAIPNLVTVPVGASGIVDIFSSAGGNLLVDFLGYYAPAATSKAGRFVPLASPQRILDTRAQGAVAIASNEVRTVAVPGGAGAAAAVLNVTTIANSAGFWTVFPAGQARPNASNLNSRGYLHTSANQVIVPLDATGNFNVYGETGGQLIVDLVGTFTGASAPADAKGLFVPLSSPTRFLDTRKAPLSPGGVAGMLLPNWNAEVAVTTNPAINRPDVAAVVLNVTVTDSLQSGYASVTPAGANDPAVKSRTTSNINLTRAAQTLPNHATVPVSARGFDIFLEGGGHVLADVAGYYLGALAAAPFGVPQNINPTPAGCVGFAPNPVAGITIGSSPAAVANAQTRLRDLGFWNAGSDGNYGSTTTQSVLAFQFLNGLPTTGKIDELTASRINTSLCVPSPSLGGGDYLEVDKGHQVLLIVRGGQTVWVVHVSTGGNYTYDEPDKKNPGQRSTGTAITPTGSYRIYRTVDEPRYEGTLGTLYRPRFVVGGVAVHGAPNVPNYPASHGCIRVTNLAMDMIWGDNWLPMGSRVIIHE